MKDYIYVTINKTTGKKGIINIRHIMYAEPFATDANATTLFLSSGGGEAGFQVVVDETLDTIVQLIKEAQLLG